MPGKKFPGLCFLLAVGAPPLRSSPGGGMRRATAT
jgi:hypothetical protein